MSTTREPVAWFQQQFAHLQEARAERDPAWLRSFRASAWECFVKAGFPTKKFEEWQYSSVAGLVKDGYTIQRTTTASSFDNAGLDALGVPFAKHRMVFVDGVYQAALSTPPTIPNGGHAGSLMVALKGDHTEAIQQKLARLLDSRVKNPFAYLNMALFEDGAYIHVPRNTVVDAPIELVMVSSGKEATLAAHPRHLICVDESAKANIIERHVSLEAGSQYWSNVATAFFIGANTHVGHVKVQDESKQAYHLAQMHVEQGQDSTLSSHLFSLGGGTSRHEVETVLNGTNISCKLNGLYIANTGQMMDNRICMEHAKAHGTSDQYYKGILGGKGQGAFSGRILVQQDAQKTDAYQTNQALLLSDDAAVFSKPQLEIYADDVKCSHGATTGNLDPNALFYLRSRGIPKRDAERILVVAFAKEVLERVPFEDLKTQLGEVIEARLAAMNF